MTHLKPRSTTILLYQGDDMDQLAHLKRALDVAKRQAPGENARAGDDDESLVAAQTAYDEALDGAAERALEIELRSIGRRRFRDLVEAHPPRMVPGKAEAHTLAGETITADTGATEMHEDDAGWGVNTAAFPRALLTFRDDDVMTLAKPEFKNKAEVEAFVDDELSEGDFEQLWAAAFLGNRQPSADPFRPRRGPTTSES